MGFKAKGRGRAWWWQLLAGCLTLCACTKGPGEIAAVHRERAQTHFAAQKYREASIEYQAALQAVPGDVEALYGMAQVHQAVGEPGEYRSALDKVLAVSPDHAGACLEVGGLYWAAGMYPHALGMARRVLRSDAGSLAARKLEARSLSRLEQTPEARAAWEQVLSDARATAVDFSDAAAFELWADDERRAREVLDAGLERYPSAPKLMIARASLLTTEGDVTAAEAVLRAALGLAADDVEVNTAWAKFLILTGRGADGAAALTAAHARFAADQQQSVRFALARAQLFLETGELSRARQVLETELGRQPNEPALAAALADVLITLGDTKQATRLLEVASRGDPGSRRAILLAARLYLESGRHLWALHTIELLIARGDLGFDARYLFARALAGAKRHARARWEFIRLLRRLPRHHLARIDYADLLLAMGEYQETHTNLDVLPPELAKTVRVRLLRAGAHLQAGDAKAAEAVVRSLLEEKPDAAHLSRLMGDIQRVQGRAAEALRFYERSRTLQPNSVDALLAQASLLEATGATRRVILDLVYSHMGTFGENAALLRFLAASSLGRGEAAEALKFVDRSLQVDANSAESRLLRGKVLLAAGEPHRAAVEFDSAIPLDPGDPRAYNALAQVHLDQGEPKRAEEVYRLLLERNPQEPITSNNLANLYLDTGRASEALQLAWDAYLGMPRNPHMMDTLGWALHQSGKLGEAERYLREAAASLKDRPVVLLHWGENLWARGEEQEGAKVLARVVQLAPESPAALQAAERLGGRRP